MRDSGADALSVLTPSLALRRSDSRFAQEQISEHIFAPNGGYYVYYPSNLFRNARSFEILAYSPVLVGEYSVM